MNDIEISIRSIQHYLYCPHRWGLLEIDRAWAENMFVTKANLMHERVHDPKRSYSKKGKKVFTSVWIYNDLEEYNLYGVVDCLEAEEAREGAVIGDDEQNYHLCIVEYKPTQPKGREYNHDDLMQVYAQKCCVDYVFRCDCDAALYYADTKKRIYLPLRENREAYDNELKRILKEIRVHIISGKIPPIVKGQKCSGCSMKDLCMPKAVKTESTRQRILRIEQEEV